MISKKLKLGDTIGIISPSAPVTEKLKNQFERGIKFLENWGFKIKIASNALKNTQGYWATPQERANDLNSMFADNEVKAIICSQGGASANWILPLIEYETIKNNPKIIIGISDITVLLNAINQKTGLVTFHGNDLIFGFGRDHTDYDENEFKERLIEGKIDKINQYSEWKSIISGVAEGVLVGGNLGCLNKLAGTEYFPDFNNKIIFLEDHDKTVTPQKAECYLHQFKQIGVFDKIKGIWLGYYSHKSGVQYEEIVMKVVNEYNFPILKCNDFGHNTQNTTIPVGAKVRLDAVNNEIIILENCVE